MLTYTTNTDTPEDDINPAEMAKLEAVVQKTLVGCLTTCVQSSVTSAEILLGEDWSQEGRAMLRRFGIEPCAAPMLITA